MYKKYRYLIITILLSTVTLVGCATASTNHVSIRGKVNMIYDFNNSNEIKSNGEFVVSIN